MTLKFRRKVLLAKPEVTYGVDAAPTGAANAILASDIAIAPMEGSDQERGHDMPNMGNAGTIPFDLHATLSFKVELQGSGTPGTPPAWGPLLRACGVGETVDAGTSVVYAPLSDGFESATLWLNIDGTLYALTGARGTCVIRVNASAIPQLEFAFTGLWTKPSTQVAPVPDYSQFQKPKMGSKANTPAFTIDDNDQVLRSFALDLGVDIAPRFLIGAEEIAIVDRAESLDLQIEARALGDLDPWALAEASAMVPVSLTHGIVAGRIAQIAIPSAQMQRPQGLAEAQGIKEWPLRLAPLPTLGNDQWSLTLT